VATRSTTQFCSGGEPVALVYKHWDGYPEEMARVFARFFAAVEAQAADTRYGDPSYLAARWVVFLAGEYAKKGGPLDFISVGVLLADPGDIDYRYVVECNERDSLSERPRVRVQTVTGEWEAATKRMALSYGEPAELLIGQVAAEA